MGIIDWLLEEIADLFTDPNKVVDHTTENVNNPQLGQFIDPASEKVESDFVDPMEQARQTIANDPILTSVQQTVNKATEIYESATGSTYVPSSVESTQQFIRSVANASPEQLNQMAATLESLNTADAITASITEHEVRMQNNEAFHQTMQDANAAQLQANSTISASEDLIAKTNRDLGTNI